MKGKIALVTGGSRGIGRAIAVKLAQEGCDVAILYAGRKEAADETVSLLTAAGARALAVQCNVADEKAAEAAVKEVAQALGPIDILVNNAGIVRDGLAMRMSSEDFRAVLDVNLTGAFHMIRACLPQFVRRRSGRIINITSVSGMMGNPGQANYASSKAGLIGLTKTIAREVASRGVTVNAVAPGFIETDMTASMNESALQKGLSAVPMGRIGKPEDVANAVCFFAGDGAGYITGCVLKVDGGMYI
ncbi:MAG TPA: 3-oxoacyl-[acyl-carrier-protein] reductase [Candidatus Pullichristensenella stercorigallinarum]|uniref:3-oxoacyl-[acyl-carrier-protein] reductase n=1 Tax=Candidatus Pullichristensenella stercorigallinarum TaxID=2840909 RepID=A0A9D0ZJW3_9FIRM|nr:3-oxoacyl-[acyl-carrier-protein] reductase [Candidatus Pullichristensenella stercorigallinarum]